MRVWVKNDIKLIEYVINIQLVRVLKSPIKLHWIICTWNILSNGKKCWHIFWRRTDHQKLLRSKMTKICILLFQITWQMRATIQQWYWFIISKSIDLSYFECHNAMKVSKGQRNIQLGRFVASIAAASSQIKSHFPDFSLFF